MEFDITKNTIFLTISGSYAYGTFNDESDIDIRGIAIPSKEYFLGYCKNFEQFEGDFIELLKKNDCNLYKKVYENIQKSVNRNLRKDEKVDSVIYDIRKFFKLASDCNPNIIEILFTDDKLHIIKTDISKILLDNRELFLSTKAKFRYSGYAFSQLKRIKTHRSWLLNPPIKKPIRSDFGLKENTLIDKNQRDAAESLIKSRINEWMFLDIDIPNEVLDYIKTNTISTLVDICSELSINSPIKNNDFAIDELYLIAGKNLGFDDNFLEYLNKEKKYKNSLRYYNQYIEWKNSRNSIRHEMEKESGYDRKHALHLVRLLNMAEEIMLDGKVKVYRDDADELLSIKNGEWEFEKLLDWAKNKQEKLDNIYKNNNSTLPKNPPYNKINNLCVQIVEEFIK